VELYIRDCFDSRIKRMKTKHKWMILAAVAFSLLAAVFFLLAFQNYHADETAREALASGGAVQISRTEYGWFFDGPSDEAALILYSGAKVEETAYAPLCRRLSENGLDVCLIHTPFHLAFFGYGKAGDVMDSLDYERWYIGGHSLGGWVAARYAAAHSEELDGVVLLAAYATKKLDEGLETILIYGSEDTVLHRGRYLKYLKNVPDDAVEYIIAGGNHAQFGSYGIQRGDGTAAITPEKQVEEAADFILAQLQ
jgi:hypothetical protein